MGKEKKFYHYWDAKTKEYMGIDDEISMDVSNGGEYIHQEVIIKIPDFPGVPSKELPDGLYVVTDMQGTLYIVTREGGDWHGGVGREIVHPAVVLGRIPIEPVDE